jgi:hypothetical protein
LAYWALTNDRRLPLAFLGRTLRDLLETPFEDLAATPGIGQKKIGTLITLLGRATKLQPRAAIDGAADAPPEKKSHVGSQSSRGGFDPTIVSEALWEQWRDTVLKHGVGCEKLGRLAPTLQSLPTVIWHTTLECYCQYSVAEIRQLKTHGEKRVRIILEVFCAVHEMLAFAKPQGHLSVRLLPKFVVPVECWIEQSIDGNAPVNREEVRQSCVIPLLEQIQTDAGATVSRLAEGRLGTNGEPQTVRQQSRRLGVTRARVYQLLEDCAKVMTVRWPEGHGRLLALHNRLETSRKSAEAASLVCAAIELFFPDAEELAARAALDGSED